MSHQLPTLDFSAFVVSLAGSAMQNLGEGPEAQSVNLELARHTIDILGMLQEKTKGNLTEEEERLLSGMLYELRLKFVEKSKS